ncbi:helix-turn-helix domain-containing protein [Chryseobacterium chendengshani]|uniref:helix-turn-helix domain-containing protein n=1 Tax=Chryseobacterium sp. LJ756 TaxID=2864113 RepID=UPI001C6414AA|nr:helix-turn-helix domain-containing protein [Chryseobacterium sp. LJ756]MBW7676053.1 XRE family transcriptional regulator [Chryseobacterium sp. LJ756]
MNQEILLKHIRKKIGDKSLNDEIANILNISYDAAHRRTSMKAKFSFEEAIELAKYYQISIDQFLGTENQLVIKRTRPVKTKEDLLHFFESSLKILDVFQTANQSKVYYSAKDIPFFYTISDTILSRFKFYVWMNLLNEDQFLCPFEDFDLPYHSPKNEMLKDLYENQNVTEVWNDTTIMSILMQISYYSEMGLLKYKDIMLILEEVRSVLQNIEYKIQNNPDFNFYVNDLVILSNNILFKNEYQSSFFLPFNMFGYMMTNDENICNDTLIYFEHEIKNSKSLNTSGNRERKMYFNKMYVQIDHLLEKLKC